MKLLKTNTTIYKERFKNAINEMAANYEYENASTINGFLLCFNDEHNYLNNKKRIPNLQKRLADYLQGAPYWFSIHYFDDIIEFTEKLHECKVPENKKDYVLSNFYNHFAYMLLKLADKDIVEKLY